MIITPGTSGFFLNGATPLTFVPPQLKDFDVYYTRYSESACGPGVCLSWSPISGAAISEYKVYKKVGGEDPAVLVTTITPTPDDDTRGVEWCDHDGTLEDSYAVATVGLSSVESDKTDWQLPTETTGKICIVYGCISDVSGVRIPDTPIMAKILQLPQTVAQPTYINKGEITVVSDSKGRFEIALIQNSLVDINIEDVYYRRTVRIPEEARVAITDLAIDRDYQLPLETY